MQHLSLPTMWSQLDDAGMMPLLDLDMNQPGGYLMDIDANGSPFSIAAPSSPLPGEAPHRLTQASAGYNNRTQIMASAGSTSHAPKILDNNGRSATEFGLRSLRFDGAQWLDMDGMAGAFPTFLSFVIRFDWNINASTGAQCLLGWNAPGNVAGIYVGSATGLLTNEVVTLRFPDGGFAYWQSPDAGMSGDIWHVLTFFWKDGNWRLRVDGVEWPLFTQGTPTRYSLDGVTAWRLGARHYEGAEQGVTGDIAQFAAGQHVAPSDVETLDRAMMQRWPMYRASEI